MIVNCKRSCFSVHACLFYLHLQVRFSSISYWFRFLKHAPKTISLDSIKCKLKINKCTTCFTLKESRHIESSRRILFHTAARLYFCLVTCLLMNIFYHSLAYINFQLFYVIYRTTCVYCLLVHRCRNREGGGAKPPPHFFCRVRPNH